MTTETPEETAAPVEGALYFTTETAAPPMGDKPGAVTPFYVDQDPTVLYAVKPKMAKLMRFSKQAEAIEEGDLSIAMSTYDDLLGMLQPESREYLEARFNDDDDTLDMDALNPIVMGLVEHWFQRPIGGRPAGAGSPSKTGKRSTGRAPSRGSKRRK